LAEIALETGFSDQPHFTRVFSRLIGAGPGAWPRTMLSGSADYFGSVESGAALVAPSGNRVALEPVVALVFELVEAPGDAAPAELVPMSLHAPSAAAAAIAVAAIAIF
jgi:hypothetical protein